MAENITDLKTEIVNALKHEIKASNEDMVKELKEVKYSIEFVSDKFDELIK